MKTKIYRVYIVRLYATRAVYNTRSKRDCFDTFNKQGEAEFVNSTKRLKILIPE